MLVHFGSSKDKKSITTSMSYFKLIEEICEIDYVAFRVSVFKCKWDDVNTSVITNEFKFTLVDLNKLGYTDEPFVMAHQARQIFYVICKIREKN